MEERKLILSFAFISIFVIICLVIFTPKLIESIEKNNIAKKIIGIWTTDGVTVYEFNVDGKGTLKLPLSEYEFTYKIEGNDIFIDYENEKSIDSSYEFSFENENMVLKGINNTIGNYTFIKK